MRNDSETGMDETALACVALGRHYGFEEGHCRQDARLAVKIFDLMADLHSLDDRCRDLLYYAGLLHDIGYVEGYWGHHKTAYKMIVKASLPGLTGRELQIVANVARYHRGAEPRLSHEGFAALEPEDRQKVTVLGAILRLADGLDRTHTDAVHDLDLSRKDGQLLLLVDCPIECSMELWAGEKKGRWLGKLFSLQVLIREVRRPVPKVGASHLKE